MYHFFWDTRYNIPDSDDNVENSALLQKELRISQDIQKDKNYLQVWVAF